MDRHRRAAAPEREQGSLLIQKAATFEASGSIEEALATLAAARPSVDAAGDPHEIYLLRFNLANNLCLLGRFVSCFWIRRASWRRPSRSAGSF